MAFGDLNRINTNLQSLESRFSLDRINKRLGQTQLRLSTGLKINKAEDDAAGFSIGAKLSSRIAGLEQALSNAGEAKSVLDIAEASLSSVLDILTELKVKATQAANDSYGAEERGFIQLQVDSLVRELDSLVDQTVYQNQNLLTGDYQATFQVGERIEDVINVQISRDGTSGQGFTAAELGLRLGTIDDDIETNRRLIVIDDGTQNAHLNAQDAMTRIDAALTTLAEVTNTIGITQSRLSIRENILTQAINSNSSAKSRIMDADFAKEQSELIKLQILQQTATAALAQANAAPQAVLGFIG